MRNVQVLFSLADGSWRRVNRKTRLEECRSAALFEIRRMPGRNRPPRQSHGKESEPRQQVRRRL